MQGSERVRRKRFFMIRKSQTGQGFQKMTMFRQKPFVTVDHRFVAAEQGNKVVQFFEMDCSRILTYA